MSDWPSESEDQYLIDLEQIDQNLLNEFERDLTRDVLARKKAKIFITEPQKKHIQIILIKHRSHETKNSVCGLCGNEYWLRGPGGCCNRRCPCIGGDIKMISMLSGDQRERYEAHISHCPIEDCKRD